MIRLKDVEMEYENGTAVIRDQVGGYVGGRIHE